MEIYCFWNRRKINRSIGDIIDMLKIRKKPINDVVSCAREIENLIKHVQVNGIFGVFKCYLSIERGPFLVELNST